MKAQSKTKEVLAMPESLKVRLRLRVPEDLKNDKAAQIRNHIKTGGLHTVCQEAACPNLGHCWSEGTATFMILGSRCTRRCGFCNVSTGRPFALDPNEGLKLAETVRQMQLRHVVITSVDRDDLKDCGSLHFAEVIRAVRQRNPRTRIETLIPDFKARLENLRLIWEAKPDIINHNVETVPSLYRTICPQSNYQNSLEVLRLSQKMGFLTKSGLILGLGESFRECCQVIGDLAACGVSILTIGQYLRPSPQHAPLKEYLPMQYFRELKEYALQMGLAYVEAGPLVRSSYHAKESFEAYYESVSKKEEVTNKVRNFCIDSRVEVP